MIFKPEVECADPGDIKKLAGQRLRKLVEYLFAKNPVYRKKLEAHGVKPENIKSIDDLVRLPVTVKDDLRETYPFGLFSVNEREIAEVHVSSGTTGNYTVVGYTKADLALWSEVVARSLAASGAVPGDRLQVAYGYGLFTGGFGLHYGGLELGLSVLPMSAGQTQRQLKLMEDFNCRVLACTPSYALHMAEEAREIGFDFAKTKWKIGVFGAEPWSNAMRQEIESIWGIKAYDIYGLSEITGPGVANECQEQDGLHVWWDVFYPEVLNPDTFEPVPEGEPGVLAITTLTKQAIPLIRYVTRDIVTLRYGKCKCGRTCPRIGRVAGRTDDMIVVRGINVFPTQIEHALLKIEGTQPYYQLIVDRKPGGMDDLEVLVEVDEHFFSDKVSKLQELAATISQKLHETLLVHVKVTLVEPKTIERFTGKSKRVIDKRKM
jgi:phenylacetate-CoA ligase